MLRSPYALSDGVQQVDHLRQKFVRLIHPGCCFPVTGRSPFEGCIFHQGHRFPGRLLRLVGGRLRLAHQIVLRGHSRGSVEELLREVKADQDRASAAVLPAKHLHDSGTMGFINNFDRNHSFGLPLMSQDAVRIAQQGFGGAVSRGVSRLPGAEGEIQQIHNVQILRCQSSPDGGDQFGFPGLRDALRGGGHSRGSWWKVMGLSAPAAFQDPGVPNLLPLPGNGSRILRRLRPADNTIGHFAGSDALFGFLDIAIITGDPFGIVILNSPFQFTLIGGDFVIMVTDIVDHHHAVRIGAMAATGFDLPAGKGDAVDRGLAGGGHSRGEVEIIK